MNSVRRGSGSDIAGSRPYRPGDDARAIDWNSSARLSSARGSDEFIVREYFAEEAPRVVVVYDRRPAMALFPPPFPWLAKPQAMCVAAELIHEAALAARGVIGYLDLAGDEPVWAAPHAGVELPPVPPATAFAAPDDSLTRAFDFLSRLQPSLPAGAFVFVLSDFLAPPPEEVWISALERHWDVVPVVIQDPVWERSFPDVGGVVVPFHDRATDRFVPVRMTPAEAVRQRVENESRATELLARLRSLDLEPVLVTTTDRLHVFDAFLAWADARVVWRGRVW